MNWLVGLALAAPGILFAITIHEYAHGRAALALGDPTARNAGRLTLNPFRHLDLVGTLMLFVFSIGWARPVPVDPNYFRQPRRDMLLVALAGPASNFVASIALALLFRLVATRGAGPGLTSFALAILASAIYIGFVLAAFNLLPVPPLDGASILAGFLPPALQQRALHLGRFGFIIALLVIVLFAYTGVIHWAGASLAMLFAGPGVLGFLPG